METRDYLARNHRRVVDESIRAVLDEVACDMGDLERNVLGVVIRQEIETRLVPALLAVDALLLGADAEMLARLPAWLDYVQAPMPADTGFLAEMVRLLDPVGSSLVEENSVLLPGESDTAQAFTDCLWEMAPLASGPCWSREAWGVHLK